MKNLYVALTLAAAVSGSAMATPAAKTAKMANIDQVLQLNTNIELLDAVAPLNVENQGRKAPSATDPQGWYVMTSVSVLSSGEEDDEDENSQMQTNGVEVIIDGTEARINGMWDMLTLKGTYDPKTQTIQVKKQDYWGLEYQGSPITIYTTNLVVDGGYITSFPEIPYIEFQYLPEGAETSTGEVVLKEGWYADPYNMFIISTPAFWGTTPSSFKGGFGSFYAMNIYNTTEYYNLPNFTYNPEEWVDKGEATFNDGWLNPYWEEEYSYKVKVQQNATNSNYVLLLNPYGEGTPWADPEIYSTPNGDLLNATPNEPGYIFLNLTDPECVLVRPFVNSGYSLNGIYWWWMDSTHTDWDYIWGGGYLGCTNDEGAEYYLNGRSYSYLKQRAEFFGYDLPMLEGTTVTIPKARVQTPEENSIIAPMAWLDQDDMPLTMVSKIELPEAALGVNGIYNDTNSTVKRYFNLQGLEIANPEAGQVVIVKEGKEAKKVRF